jgi:hypothetical protein
MKKIVSIFVLTCILSGCKKSTNEDENYTLKGIVIDFDSKQPVVGAKVFQYEFCCAQQGYKDSAVSDANGMVSFNCKKEGDYKILTATKDNYLRPQKYVYYQVLAHISRTDTVFLAKPSFLQLTIHKSNTYQPSDSIVLRVEGDYYSPSSGRSTYRTLVMDKANSPDKVFNLYTFYELPNYDKLFFHYQIIRNGTLLTDQYISTDLIQFGIKNFTLNY